MGGFNQAELYDCIPNALASSTGVCCPNGALACVQPVATGGAAADFARWLVGVGQAAAAEGLAALRH